MLGSLAAFFGVIRTVLQIASLFYYAYKALESIGYSTNSKVTTIDPSRAIPIIYGEHRTGGNIIYQKFDGAYNRKMYLLVGLCEGPIYSITDVMVDDVPIGELDGLLHPCSATPYLGTGSQNVPGFTDAATVGGLRYTAYLALELTKSDKLGDGIPNVTCIVRGKTVQVWHPDTESWVEEWSQNPVWCILDFLRSTRYGPGIPDAFLDLDSFKTAALICDEVVNGKPRYMLNVQIDWEESWVEVLNRLRLNCNAYFIQYQGKFSIRILQPGPSVYSFDADSILPGSMVYTEPSIDEVYDVVRVWYTDPEKDWSRQSVEYHGTNAINPNTLEIDVYGTTSREQAFRLAAFHYRFHKYCGAGGSFGTGLKGADRTPGDIIDVTWPGFLWNQRLLMLEEVNTQDTNEMELVYRIYDPRLFTEDEYSGDPGAVSVPLPNPREAPPDPTDLLVTETVELNRDGTKSSWIDITFTPPISPFYEKALVQLGINGTFSDYALITTNYYRLGPLSRRAINGILIDYQIKVKSVNSAQGNGLMSPGVTSGTFNLTGEINPDDVTGLSVYLEKDAPTLVWNAVADTREIEYEIRRGDTWETGTMLGRTTGTTFTIPGAGTYWVAAKFCDVYSPIPAMIVVEGQELVHDYRAIYDEHPDWNGTCSSGVYKVRGELFLGGLGLIFDVEDFFALPDVFGLGGVPLSGTFEPSEHEIVLTQISRCEVSASCTLLSAPETTGVKVQIATADNDVYGEWQDVVSGMYLAGKKFKFRLYLTSDGNVTARVSTMTTSVDVPDIVEDGRGILIPEGGWTIHFKQTFHVPPSITLTILNAQPGDDAVIAEEEITTTQFKVAIINGKNGVSRKINYHAHGW